MCSEARGLALSQGNRNQRASPIKISVPGLLIEKKDSFKMYGNCFIHTCSPLLQDITVVPPVPCSKAWGHPEEDEDGGTPAAVPICPQCPALGWSAPGQGVPGSMGMAVGFVP